MVKKNAIMIVPQKDFRDEELLDTKKILEDRGIKVKVASRTRDKILGVLGTEMEPDLAIREIEPKDYLGVYFVGGPGAVEFFEDEDAIELAREFKWGGKVVAATHIAPSILANAGCLVSKVVTAAHTEEENLRNKGADFTGMPVEVDGKVVTGRGPNYVKDFAEKLAYALEEPN